MHGSGIEVSERGAGAPKRSQSFAQQGSFFV